MNILAHPVGACCLLAYYASFLR